MILKSIYEFIKKIILSLALVFLTACISNENATQNSSNNQQAVYNKLLSLESGSYYVYLYSKYCDLCHDFENEATGAQQKAPISFYFVEVSTETVFESDIEKVKSSIGATAIADILIYTTPTLLLIENHTLQKNIFGIAEIREEFASF